MCRKLPCLKINSIQHLSLRRKVNFFQKEKENNETKFFYFMSEVTAQEWGVPEISAFLRQSQGGGASILRSEAGAYFTIIGTQTSFFTDFGGKLSFILSFLFPERLHCCYIYFHCSYLHN